VPGWIKERREFLQALESGEQDPVSSYTEALDLWISVDDEYQRAKEVHKDA